MTNGTRPPSPPCRPRPCSSTGTRRSKGRPADQGSGRRTAPAWSRSPKAFVPTYPDWVWRTTPWADGEWYARWSTSAVDVPGPACDALGAIAARERRLPRDPRERARRRHRLQHDPLLRPRRRAARQAPQARADRRRAARVGHGRRFDAPGLRHAVRTRRRAHLLGELHAARAAAMYEQGIDILLAPTWDNSDVWVAVDAAHREGRPLLRARHHVVPARRPTFPPTSPAATRSTAATTTGCRAATR